MRILTECQSAPERHLFKAGNEFTYQLLLEAAAHMSPEELSELEEDLRLYAETRLIGVHMSRLLRLLRRRAVTATLSRIEHAHFPGRDGLTEVTG